MTVAPAAAHWRARASPMPEEAPVIQMTEVESINSRESEERGSAE